MTPWPLTQELVLIGGGHTHALVLKHFGMRPLPGVSITVINPGPTAPYTGMLPGHIAGHYTRAELDIDLYRLARFAGARLLTTLAFNIDLDEKRVRTGSGRDVSYDVASVDVGVTSMLSDTPGFATHGIAAKPLGPLAQRWRAFLADRGGDDVVVIGGGVAGVELALAMAHRLRQDRPGARVTLVERGRALTALPKASADKLREQLMSHDITLRENTKVLRLSDKAVHLTESEVLASDFTVSAAGARPHPWLAGTGLALEGGYIRVDARLQTSDRAVFAAGDCAHLAHAPRPKAGVFAVRAAPVLAANLKAALAGGPMRRFGPQRDYLKLVSLGAREALGEKAGVALSGPWVWRVKDRIDRAFMAKLNDLTPMGGPAVPKRAAKGVREELEGRPVLCGGCGAKVGAGPLGDILGPGDDAAIERFGDPPRVITTDTINAFTGDPFLVARIAALHAMGDVWAMGARPVNALAQVTLPRMSAALQRRWLKDVTIGARVAFDVDNVDLIGGHTTQGAALQIGFTVTGVLDGSAITHAGARSGDALILTRPLGSGTLLAADMALQARGEDLSKLFAVLTQPSADAAQVLRKAHAMTDVTGFGLAGHLMTILKASGLGAELSLDALPLFDGVAALLDQGVRSTLWSANQDAAPVQPSPDPRAAILHDPQTAGGLLAAVAPDTARNCLQSLIDLGHGAAIIGHLTDGPATIKLL
ncbi:MAG: selenide, water dikinase SelD [Pseudomonadota bacterium]